MKGQIDAATNDEAAWGRGCMYTRLDDCSTADAVQVDEYAKKSWLCKTQKRSYSLVRSYGKTNFHSRLLSAYTRVRKTLFQLENLTG